jgi:hypothetical protein
MIGNIILNSFPRIRNSFTKYTYLYLALVFFIFQQYLFVNNQYWLIFFISLVIIGYMLNSQNKKLIGDEDRDFRDLEEKMDVIIPKDYKLTNYLYFDPNILEFLYDIRAFKLTDTKNFDEMVIRINRFLQIYGKVTDSKKAESIDIETLSILKVDALNHFHAILFSLVNDKEMNRHNELRYMLEEKLTGLYNECLEHRDGPIRLQDFGYNPSFNPHYDIY